MVGYASATGPEPGSPSARPVDLVHLSKYTLGNHDLENELLGLFRSQSAIYVARLEAAATDKEWADAAHSLKGSARGIGAWHVADVSEAAERLVGDGGAAQRLEALSELKDVVEAANRYIDQLAANPAG